MGGEIERARRKKEGDHYPESRQEPLSGDKINVCPVQFDHKDRMLAWSSMCEPAQYNDYVMWDQ